MKPETLKEAQSLSAEAFRKATERFVENARRCTCQPPFGHGAYGHLLDCPTWRSK